MFRGLSRCKTGLSPLEQEFLNISTKKGKLKLLKKHPLLFFNIAIKKIRNTKFRKPIVFDYERTCKKMTTRSPYFRNSCPGIFTSWDKTPRNGSKATIYKNSTPKAFGEFLKKQAERAKKCISYRVFICNCLE